MRVRTLLSSIVFAFGLSTVPVQADTIEVPGNWNFSVKELNEFNDRGIATVSLNSGGSVSEYCQTVAKEIEWLKSWRQCVNLTAQQNTGHSWPSNEAERWARTLTTEDTFEAPFFARSDYALFLSNYKDQQIAKLESTATELREERDTLKGELSDRDERVAELEEMVTERDSVIATLEGRLEASTLWVIHTLETLRSKETTSEGGTSSLSPINAGNWVPGPIANLSTSERILGVLLIAFVLIFWLTLVWKSPVKETDEKEEDGDHVTFTYKGVTFEFPVVDTEEVHYPGNDMYENVPLIVSPFTGERIRATEKNLRNHFRRNMKTLENGPDAVEA